MQLPDERVPNDSKIDKDRYMLGRGRQRTCQGIMIGKGTSYCNILNGTKASITYESGQGAPLWSTDIHTCDDNMHNAVAAHAGRKNKTSNDDLTDTGRAKCEGLPRAQGRPERRSSEECDHHAPDHVRRRRHSLEANGVA